MDFYTEFKDNHAYYVDKTMFIAKVLENASRVQLYTRPRRFGKTMSLTTFHTFIASHDYLRRPFDPKPYFEGKKIMSCGDEILSRMGKHPVIFMSLKECCKPTFEQSLLKYADAIAGCCQCFRKLERSNNLEQNQIDAFMRFVLETATQNELEKSIRLLSEFITIEYGIKPYILIDE